MNAPLWLTRIAIDVLHYDQLAEHGGLAGLRDDNGLESILARPANRWNYDGVTDLPSLAAIYGHGLTKGHPYVDGNKRIGFLAMVTFLGVNGMELDANDRDVVHVMRAVASGAVTEEALAAWIRSRARARSG
jgi:death on curing protein